LEHEEKAEIPNGKGVFTNPSGMEILKGWGSNTKKPSVKGINIFLELHNGEKVKMKITNQTIM